VDLEESKQWGAVSKSLSTSGQSDESAKLAEQKRVARQKLLSMPPEFAQRSAEQTLYPKLWEADKESFAWVESLPRRDKDCDDSTPEVNS
jgi:hypothetical protein